MAWGRLDDSFFNHPKVQQAGIPALGLWVLALSFASKYETDGVLTATDLRRLHGRSRDRDRLIEVGLWDVHPDGYAIHDYLDYNPSHAYLIERRAAGRERVKKARDRATAEPPLSHQQATAEPPLSQAAAADGPFDDEEAQVRDEIDADVTALHDPCNTTPGPALPIPGTSPVEVAAADPRARTGPESTSSSSSSEESSEEGSDDDVAPFSAPLTGNDPASWMHKSLIAPDFSANRNGDMEP